MRKTLCLLLCLPMLLLGGCKEEPPADVGNYGSYYEVGQIRQISSITLTKDRTALIAPAESLTVTLHNNSDYAISLNMNDRFLEINREGTWEAPTPCLKYIVPDIAVIGGNGTTVQAHSRAELSLTFALEASSRAKTSDGNPPKQYSPLEAGYYRLRLPNCQFKDLPQGTTAEPFEVVCYFHVNMPSLGAAEASYTVNGITQNPYVHFSVLQVTGSNVQYRVYNVGDASVDLLFSEMTLQYYDAAANAFTASEFYPAHASDEGLTFPLAAGLDIAERLHLVRNTSPDPYVFPAGLYRLKLPCRFEGQEGSFIVFADFIVTAPVAINP